MAENPYIYKALRSSSNVRRLRHVNVASSQNLHFHIAEFDQTDSSSPPYRCLSYTWGNPLDCEADPDARDEWSDQHLIYLSDPEEDEWRTATVTTNLYEFLEEFVSDAASSDLSWIWIDAICINQADYKERTAQVSLMREIYICCTEVIIWLGRDGEDWRYISEMIDLAAKIPPDVYKRMTEVDPSMTFREWPDYGFSESNEETTQKAFIFLRRAWFHRIWTIQEAVLPSRGQVWCGSIHVTNMEAFSRISLITRYSMAASAEELGLYVPWPVESALDYLNSFLFRYQFGNKSFAFLSGESRTLHPARCLRYSRTRKGAVLHDHVYATLGLQREPIAQCDYRISVKELFTQATLHPSMSETMFEYGGLGNAVDTAPSRCKVKLPSWVPDWSSPHVATVWEHICKRGTYYAGGIIKAQVTVTPSDDEVIRVAGFQEDVVALLGGMSPVGPDALFKSLELLVAAYDARNMGFGTDNVLERLARALSIDIDWEREGRCTTEKLSSMFREFVTHTVATWLSKRHRSDDDRKQVRSIIDNVSRISEDASRFIPTWSEIEKAVDGIPGKQSPHYGWLLATTFDRRVFFITKKGNMGLAHRVTEIGDAIVIVDGYEWPLMMRRGSQDRWQFISQAYVENIMHGEALEGRTLGVDLIDIE